MNSTMPSIGIGGCLVGQKVRYNGEAKRKNRYIEDLRSHVAIRSFCPEMAIGMGAPREPVRLVGELGAERLKDSASQSLDYTAPIQDYAAEVIGKNPDLAGYGVVKGSPRGGWER